MFGSAAREAPFTFATREVGRERVESLLPEAAERVEPCVDVVERRRVDGVEPPGALGPDRREAALAQDLEVLRDGRLRDPELGLDYAVIAPEVDSPWASSSRIRRRTGSPRTSNACTAAF